jgi:hypothetical protein
MRGSCERAGAPPSPMDVRTDPCWRGGSGHSLRRLGPRDASHETFRDQLSRAPRIFADVLCFILTGSPMIQRRPIGMVFEMASVTGPGDTKMPDCAELLRRKHTIDAVLAGQGIALCGDVVVAEDLASGAIVKCSMVTRTIRPMPITRTGQFRIFWYVSFSTVPHPTTVAQLQTAQNADT